MSILLVIALIKVKKVFPNFVCFIFIWRHHLNRIKAIYEINPLFLSSVDNVHFYFLQLFRCETVSFWDDRKDVHISLEFSKYDEISS